MEPDKTPGCAPTPADLVSAARFTTRTLTCRGCDNNCLVTRYDFGDGRPYFSGNRCENIFSNKGTRPADSQTGRDAYSRKIHLLFDRADTVKPEHPSMRIGIPRVLGMFEDFPFWHALFTGCGIEVVLSSPSDMRRYESCAGEVMSDNICFPAKLVHAHLHYLQDKGVDRIFFPFVVYGPRGKDQNSYNCPIVAGYSQVVQDFAVKIDAPLVSMQYDDLLLKRCTDYLATLGVGKDTVKSAFARAVEQRRTYDQDVCAASRQILSTRPEGRLVIMLAGRPYHADPLIQHKVSQMICSMGVDVITDDIVRDSPIDLDDVDFLSQWTYTNRILRAAKWVGGQGPEVQFVELTSFGCGPDAFLVDALRDLLARHGKSLTLLKLDDISNLGSMKLRVRSLVDSLALAGDAGATTGSIHPHVATPPFMEEDRRRTIIAPFFTPFFSPVIPAIMKNVGYTVECLPQSDPSSAEIGLKYANNEVCYPATLVVGDIIKALQSGRYDLSDTAVAMTQTGGQCRASNYLYLIKKALVDAGFKDIPVISVNFDSNLVNYQPGFQLPWLKLTPITAYGTLFTDALAKLYYPAAVRERIPGRAAQMKDDYLKQASDLLYAGRYKDLLPLIAKAAKEFDELSDDSVHPKVGLVGEIYLKFNPFAHQNLPQWLMERGVEIVPPILADFFMQYFPNRTVNKAAYIEKSSVPDWVVKGIYSLLLHIEHKFDKACGAFRYYVPFTDLYEEAGNASEIVSIGAQFGEGWLLPGEVSTLYKHGVRNVLSVQPFGCIANHVVVRGIEKKLKRTFPDLNLLAVDFDSGVSEVNILNRMLLFVENLRD